MKKQLLLRVEDSQLQMIKEAAERFHETTSAFVLNSTLLRMQTGANPQKLDPFEQAIRHLRETKPAVPLSPQARAAVVADREAVRNGKGKGVSAKEASEDLKQRLKAMGL